MRHIRLGYQRSIGIGLRLHGVPHSKSSSLHRSFQPLPFAAMLLWGTLSFSSLLGWMLRTFSNDELASPILLLMSALHE